METQRQKKIERLLQKDIGEILSDLIRKKIGNTIITVTKVRVSSDLSKTKVYLSLYTTTDKKFLMNEIEKHNKEIRLLLGNRIRHQLRVVPELLFFEDDTLDYIERIEDLLKNEL